MIQSPHLVLSSFENVYLVLPRPFGVPPNGGPSGWQKIEKMPSTWGFPAERPNSFGLVLVVQRESRE